VEPKAITKEKLGRSPDEDGLHLAYFERDFSPVIISREEMDSQSERERILASRDSVYDRNRQGDDDRPLWERARDGDYESAATRRGLFGAAMRARVSSGTSASFPTVANLTRCQSCRACPTAACHRSMSLGRSQACTESSNLARRPLRCGVGLAVDLTAPALNFGAQPRPVAGIPPRRRGDARKHQQPGRQQRRGGRPPPGPFGTFPVALASGGGILNVNGGTLNVVGCTITGNEALGGTTGQASGGFVAVPGSEPMLLYSSHC
jgi:hypothetical protein